MIAAIFRIILLLLPLVAVVLWIRWRSKKDRTEEELHADMASLRRTLLVLLAVAIVSVLGFWWADTGSGDARTKYIPPHTENGQVVPGRFVPIDDDDPDKDDQPKDGEQREQDPG